MQGQLQYYPHAGKKCIYKHVVSLHGGTRPLLHHHSQPDEVMIDRVHLEKAHLMAAHF